LSIVALVVPASSPDNFDALRQAFLQRINAARSQAKLRALRLSDKLSGVAQRRAREFAAGGSEPGASTAERDGRAAVAQGFDPQYLSEVLVQADGDVDMVFSEAAGAAGMLADELRRPSLRDTGIGVAVRDEIPVYVFLFAVSWEDFVSGKRVEFSDLQAVRRALLDRVNRERRAVGVPPMREEPLLDETAQRHAADMLARSYYDHNSPEGTTVLERSQTAGYLPNMAAENIARGQYAIEEVMDGWMSSPLHRENILSPLFADIGSGLAVGKNANGYQILWVQCFGRSRTGSPWRRQRSRPPGKS
jgi:uncharacterized protein YkwD